MTPETTKNALRRLRRLAAEEKDSDKLKEIASKNGAMLPSELTATEQHELNKLNKLSGQEFDKELRAHWQVARQAAR